LPTNDIPLSTIFSHLEDAKTILKLQDYSVSQTTLDQVFVSFASLQNNDLQAFPEGSMDHNSITKTSNSEQTDASHSSDHEFRSSDLIRSTNTNVAFEHDSERESPQQEPEPDYLYYQLPTQHKPKHSNHGNAVKSSPVRGSHTTRPKRQTHSSLLTNTQYINYATLGLRTYTSGTPAISSRLPTFSYTFTPNHHLYGYPAAYAAYAAGWNSQPPPPLTYATVGSRVPVTMSAIPSIAASTHLTLSVDPSHKAKQRKH
jgi:hypothetical protein